MSKIRIAGFWSDKADRKVSITVDGKSVAVKKDTVRDKSEEVVAYVAIVDLTDGAHEVIISGKVNGESTEIKRPVETPWKPRPPKQAETKAAGEAPKTEEPATEAPAATEAES